MTHCWTGSRQTNIFTLLFVFSAPCCRHCPTNTEHLKCWWKEWNVHIRLFQTILSTELYCIHVKKKKVANNFSRPECLFYWLQLGLVSRQDKDSKDEASKAEKELEDIRKVIKDSGGKLSNRLLQDEVREQENTRDKDTALLVFDTASVYLKCLTNGIIRHCVQTDSKCCFYHLTLMTFNFYLAGIYEAKVWRLHYFGNSQPSWAVSRRWVQPKK